jgi:hypothetical protein
MAKQGDWEHPPEVNTTMTKLEIFEEMMREAMYGRTYK